MKELSKQKMELAEKTTADLVAAMNSDVPDRLKAGFVELFLSLPNKSLERLRGLLAGVSTDKTGSEPSDA